LPLHEREQGSDVLWEQVNPARSVSLGVSVSLPDELRLVLWVPASQGAGNAAIAQPPAVIRKG